jgi:hypothetical protein
LHLEAVNPLRTLSEMAAGNFSEVISLGFLKRAL